jgi:hypothetical protein
MQSIDKDLGKKVFVDEYGATCKTYLWKAITTKLCCEGQIVLAVASCGIADLLLHGVTISHSVFLCENKQKVGAISKGRTVST